VLCHPTDVGDEAAVKALVAASVERFGGLDVVIANAGMTMWTRLDALEDLGVLERLMRVNYLGAAWLAAAALPQVERVWFVDLNPHNRAFVAARAQSLGLEAKVSCLRDLSDPALPAQFDTIVCLDVLEHLADPSAQLQIFAERMTPSAIALLNWYFFKGYAGEYPFHFDDPILVDTFFRTLQSRFLEVFHPLLITTRAYRLMA
jgi:hypothetical protein